MKKRWVLGLLATGLCLLALRFGPNAAKLFEVTALHHPAPGVVDAGGGY